MDAQVFKQWLYKTHVYGGEMKVDLRQLLFIHFLPEANEYPELDYSHAKAAFDRADKVLRFYYDLFNEQNKLSSIDEGGSDT